MERPAFLPGQLRDLDLGKGSPSVWLMSKTWPIPKKTRRSWRSSSLDPYRHSARTDLPRHRHQDPETLLAAADLTAERLPGAVACDLGDVCPLPATAEHISPAVRVKLGLGVKVATEGLAVLDLRDRLLKAAQRLGQPGVYCCRATVPSSSCVNKMSMAVPLVMVLDDSSTKPDSDPVVKTANIFLSAMIYGDLRYESCQVCK